VPLEGILVIDKPSGPTSSDVVQRVKRLLRATKVGHTGTLDPLATGVLPLCLGRATRLAQFLTEADKSYRAEVRLGVRTDTGDSQGRAVQERPVPVLTATEIEAALATLRGEQLQTPPMYSAVKVAGERLYEAARRGEEVARAARPVRVDRFELIGATADSLTVEVDCSKGTYVRTLVEDLGERLGCGAHVTALRRLRSGRFGLGEAVSLEALEAAAPPERVRLAAGRLFSLERAVDGMPRQRLDANAAEGVRHGRVPPAESAPAGLVALVDGAGCLLAVARADGRGGLVLQRVFTGAIDT
jgi:tRNA pseudouridine55 synthase